ncbi:MAG: RnfABCDGE type electron transport complex subunit D, partial [Eubacterium sp.]|nr:RnfABCDGE type electron transport complex subunit D [Eubacterium sp.]
VLVLVSAACCVASDCIFNLIVKKKQTVSDLSAVVTGVLLGLNLPPTLPFYMAAIGSVAAIIVVKQFFGGIGQNFANPAITARIVLMLSFTSYMTTWVEPFWYRGESVITTTATPLATESGLLTYSDLFFGLHGGCIGETCALALLIGGVYLIALRIIHPVTPFAFIGTVALFSFLSGGDALREILSGGLMLGAIFMATDYATTPITVKGKLIFGIGCGLITVLIRQFGAYPEGVSYSILLMNILTPQIEKFTKPKAFGVRKEARRK